MITDKMIAIKELRNMSCENCKYYNKKDDKCEDHRNCPDVIKIAVAAIKRLVPKKVSKTEDFEGKIYHECAKCSNKFMSLKDYKFCPMCGQAFEVDKDEK